MNLKIASLEKHGWHTTMDIESCWKVGSTKPKQYNSFEREASILNASFTLIAVLQPPRKKTRPQWMLLLVLRRGDSSADHLHPCSTTCLQSCYQLSFVDGYECQKNTPVNGMQQDAADGDVLLAQCAMSPHLFFLPRCSECQMNLSNDKGVVGISTLDDTEAGAHVFAPFEETSKQSRKVVPLLVAQLPYSTHRSLRKDDCSPFKRSEFHPAFRQTQSPHLILRHLMCIASRMHQQLE